MSLVKAVWGSEKLLYLSLSELGIMDWLPMFVGIACLLVFLAMAGLMYARKLSTLLALPLMAILIAIIGGIPPEDILSKVIGKGVVQLNVAYTTTMIGAMLAELMNKQGIAKAVVRWVAEFGGDNPFILSILLTAVTGLLFSTLGGLGAVIMVGTIVLPVMLSIGLNSVTAGSLLLFGIGIGGMFTLSNWQVYIDLLGVSQAAIVNFIIPFAGIMSALVLVFLGFELKKLSNLPYIAVALALMAAAYFSIYSTAGSAAGATTPKADVSSIWASGALFAGLLVYAFVRHRNNCTSLPGLALLTPFLPLAYVLLFHWDIIPAFLAGLMFGTLITWQRNSINSFTRCIIEGVTNVVPAVIVMMGIGMLYVAVTADQIKQAMAPLLLTVIPTHALPYIIFFTVAAPLSLYRGPLNIWGMGSGLATLIKKATSLSPPAIYAMLMSVGQIQTVCDPTNTQNIWVATYLGIDTKTILVRTIPYVWFGVVAGLCLAVSLGAVPW